MEEYTKKVDEANATLLGSAQSALNVLSMVDQTQTIKNVMEVLQMGVEKVEEAKANRNITHKELQGHASLALKQAMKEGVAYETRQNGDTIIFTAVTDKVDEESIVLAVSYPDGGINYYPTEVDRSSREYALPEIVKD